MPLLMVSAGGVQRAERWRHSRTSPLRLSRPSDQIKGVVGHRGGDRSAPGLIGRGSGLGQEVAVVIVGVVNRAGLRVARGEKLRERIIGEGPRSFGGRRGCARGSARKPSSVLLARIQAGAASADARKRVDRFRKRPDSCSKDGHSKVTGFPHCPCGSGCHP